jgi:hypothetical protein
MRYSLQAVELIIFAPQSWQIKAMRVWMKYHYGGPRQNGCKGVIGVCLWLAW